MRRGYMYGSLVSSLRFPPSPPSSLLLNPTSTALHCYIYEFQGHHAKQSLAGKKRDTTPSPSGRYDDHHHHHHHLFGVCPLYMMDPTHPASRLWAPKGMCSTRKVDCYYSCQSIPTPISRSPSRRYIAYLLRSVTLPVWHLVRDQAIFPSLREKKKTHTIFPNPKQYIPIN